TTPANISAPTPTSTTTNSAPDQRPSPERSRTQLGIDPDAVAKHEANAASITEAFYDPNIIDCGRAGCRERRK
ncbi:hypothetical protein, partial [Streptomyces sp. NPDC057428]|uniref:hypothetical protein n=1 Tax=Streptomyces sp. NPDC057428 TaxID=3346129 RepID=UPI0036CD9E5E